jgi:hypothetical protein
VFFAEGVPERRKAHDVDINGPRKHPAWRIDPMTRRLTRLVPALAPVLAPALALSLAIAFVSAGNAAAATGTAHRHTHHAAPQQSWTNTSGSSWGWRPAEPNAPPISLFSYFRSHGYCVIDEGYGRATLCD